MTREEIGKWLVDASMSDVLMVHAAAHHVFRARLTMLRDRQDMARREAQELDDAGIRDVRAVFDHDSFRGVPGGRELLAAVAVEAERRGLE